MTLRTKFFTLMVLSSLLGALITGTAQLRYEYGYQLGNLHKELTSIEGSTLPAIESAVWALDQKQILNLAQSIYSRPNIDHVMIKGKGIHTVTLGTLEQELHDISQVYDLAHNINNTPSIIGTLTVQASLTPLRNEMLKRSLVLITSSIVFIGIVLISCAVLLRTLVIRPLKNATQYLDQFSPLKNTRAFHRSGAPTSREFVEFEQAISRFRSELNSREAHREMEQCQFKVFTHDNPEIIWRADLSSPQNISQDPQTLAQNIVASALLTELNPAAQKMLTATESLPENHLFSLPFIEPGLILWMTENQFRVKEQITQFQGADGEIQYFRNSLVCWITQGLLRSIWGIAFDITQTLTTQKALEQRERQLYLSQTRLSEAQALAHMGHWTYFADGDRLQVSDEFARIYGYDGSKTRIGWRTLLDRIHPDDKSYVIHALSDPRSQAAGAEHRIVWPNGETRYVQAITRKSIANNRVESTFGILIDITDRRRAEEERSKSQRALAESEARLAQAQAIAHMGHWLLDCETQHLLCSDEFYRLLGHTPQIKPFTQTSFIEHVHKDDRPLINHLFESAQEKPFTNEFRVVKSSGEQRFMRGTFTPFYAGGKTTPRIFGILMDVTEQKNAELELRASQELFATAFDSSPDGIFLVDCKTSHLIKVNTALTGMLNTEEHTLLKKRFDETPLYMDEQHNRHICQFLKLQQSATNIEIQIDNATQPTVNGLLSWQHVHIAQKPCVLGIIHDVTAIRKLQKTTNDQQKQLIQADKLASIGTMVAGVAHEINNPNHLIQMNAELLEGFYTPLMNAAQDHINSTLINGLSFDELQATVPELLSDLKVSSDRINRIVNDLKDFARPQEKPEFKKTSLNLVIIKTLNLISSLKEKQSVNVQLNLTESDPQILADDQRLEQVLINLIMNAIEATDTADGEVMIRTQENPSNKTVTCEIEDAGCGITPENLPRIFDPFFTTKQDKGGTGLGLAISYRLIQEHGGSLEAKSHAHQGTTMIIQLPCA